MSLWRNQSVAGKVRQLTLTRAIKTATSAELSIARIMSSIKKIKVVAVAFHSL